MNFENLILRGLFVACILVCGLMMAAMITTHPAPHELVAAHTTVRALSLASAHCTLPGEGVTCLGKIG